MTLNTQQIAEAASLIYRSSCESRRVLNIPVYCCPTSRAEAYAVQAEVTRLSGARALGWKIAATSAAGQKHIRVDQPLAGRLLADHVLGDGARLSLKNNLMRVAEAEFAFRVAQPLAPRGLPYEVDEILGAMGGLLPAIELPDTRFVDCTRVGSAQLIADNACAGWFVFGAESPVAWRDRDLAAHEVRVTVNDRFACDGRGANVLGDPRLALCWLVNELRAMGIGLEAGDLVSTGTCVTPHAVSPGDRVCASFGELGSVSLSLTD